MSTATDNTIFTMAIPLEAHRIAQAFRDRHADSAKGKQVYLNTLAVYAVHEYLQVLGISTNLASSPSWNPITQTLSDTGALSVDGEGQFECRPVLPDAESCYVPPETWSDRLGYIAVQFDNQLETAMLLGFIAVVDTEQIALQQLSPVEDCLDVLEDGLESHRFQSEQGMVIHLGQWLQNTVETGWHTLESLFQTPQLAFNFRGETSPLARLIEEDDSIIRCRPLDLSVSDRPDDFALVVSVKPHSTQDLDIWVRVLPLGSHVHLPSDLELSLRDVDGQLVMHAQSRETESIGLKFRGAWGDRFSIQIKTSSAMVVEHFMI